MNNDMNEMLGRVLNDPQAMSGLMKIAQGLMNNSSQEESSPARPPVPESDEAPEREEAPSPQSPLSQLPPGLLSGLPRILSYDENRANLLNALKPYLSDGRRDKVEHILNILKILQLAGSMK